MKTISTTARWLAQAVVTSAEKPLRLIRGAAVYKAAARVDNPIY